MYYNNTNNNNNRGYGDFTDGREMGPKRQRLMDQGSSYYGASPGYGASTGYGASPGFGPAATPGSSYMYNPPPYTGYTGQPPPFPVVRLRGLPFGCTEADISEFFRGLDIVDVLFVHKGGKFTGEAYCVLGYPMQVDFALQRNRQNMGRRYVEVFRSKRHEYYKAIANEVADAQNSSPPARGPRARSHDERKDSLEHTGILKLRGLPYSATKDDIKEFFKDFVLEEDVIHITYNGVGKPSGEAFVEFSGPEDSRAAMVKDNMTLGNRYIELFPAAREEMDEAISKGRPPNPDENPNEPAKHTGVLRLRGLPFSATEDDILEFFNSFKLSKDAVHITFHSDGRATGEAFVEFASAEDSEAAMEKDRKTLGSRYIELFASSQEELNEALSKGR